VIYAVNGLRFQQQADANWCWAAVSWMVADFYSQGSGPVQWQIASQLTGGQCGPARPSNPNDVCYNLINLANVLSVLGHLARPMVPQPQPFSLVQQEISGQRPICAQVALPGLTHYVVLASCADDGSIRVFDPEGWYDTSFNTFTTFNMQNPRGFCTGWYLTS
jgi:hypothetical protein